ncbi:MAG: glycosyltransferase involved in cell wall biosynthesis [Brevundimonas sp.]|jgi:glycosyltransferase involved in cell wall biosynthesis|uniref:glycosyltransferase n=1 Tax=Brevundimonas sp. TaxID=1871086 RepID=UPI0039E2A7D2
MTVLHITQDGITDHIGQSQLAPYILGLADLGHDIHVLSAEKPGREALISRYRTLFDQAGVRWTIVPYYNRPPVISTAWVLWLLYRAAGQIVRREPVSVLHCRGHLAGFVGQRLKHRFGARLLLDFRDFWLDVRIDRGRFPWVYRILKRFEPGLIRQSDQIVALTRRAVELLQARYPETAARGHNVYTVIPCCADFAHFRVDEAVTARSAVLRTGLAMPAGSTVLLYLGSLGPDYLLNRMIALFGQLRALRPDSVMLFLSNNGEPLVRDAATAAGLPADSIRFANSGRDDVPAYIALASLSVVFINPVHKEGCSPTKLAELLACNVPVVANTGVGDLDILLSPDANGSVVVEDFEPATLRAALVSVLERRDGREDGRIRDASWGYSLEEGVKRYQAVYDALGETPASV